MRRHVHLIAVRRAAVVMPRVRWRPVADRRPSAVMPRRHVLVIADRRGLVP